MAGLGPVQWFVEKDAYCQKVLARHYPAVPRHPDVRAVGAHNLTPVDVVCGGSPCQDLSNAGRRLGIEGLQSGLWSEFARVVGELRPRYVVFENVAAAVHRGLGRIVGDLAALGYDAWWDCLRASDVGAPHRRDRLFLVGWDVADGLGHGQRQPGGGVGEERRRAGHGGAALADRGGAGLEERSGVSGHPRPQRPPTERGRTVARDGTVESGLVRASDGLPGGVHPGWPKRPGRLQYPYEPPRTAYGVPDRQARIRALGNSCVPQVAAVVGRVLLEIHAELPGEEA